MHRHTTYSDTFAVSQAKKSKGKPSGSRNLSGTLCNILGLFMVHHLVTWFDYGPVAACSAHNKQPCHTYFVMGGSAIFIFAPVFRLQNEYSSKYFGIGVSVMTVTALHWHFSVIFCEKIVGYLGRVALSIKDYKDEVMTFMILHVCNLKFEHWFDLYSRINVVKLNCSWLRKLCSCIGR